MSELSNGDSIRADRDRCTAAFAMLFWAHLLHGYQSVVLPRCGWRMQTLMCRAMCSFLDGSSCTALALWMVPSMFTSRPPHE